MDINSNESLIRTSFFLDKIAKYNLNDLNQSIQKLNQLLDLRDTKNKRKSLNFTSTPFVFSNKDYHQLSSVSHALHLIIEKIVDAWYLGDLRLRNFFQIPEFFIPLIYKQHQHWQTYARYDFIITKNGQVRLNEFNSASPGAIVTTGALNSVTRNHLSKLTDDFDFIEQPLEKLTFFADIIERMEQEANIETACIAILYDDHYMLFELFEFANQLSKRNRDVVVCHVNECKYINGQLIVKNRLISTVVNNFFLRGKNLQLDETGPWQTLTINNNSHPYWPLCQAVMENKVLLTHGFAASLIIEDKRFFSILKSSTFSYLFSKEEKMLIEQLIPSTLSNVELSHNADLLEKIITDKDKYVYKSALSGAGLGIIFGESVTKNKWHELLKQTEYSYAIQEKLQPYSFKILWPEAMTLNHNLSYFIVFGELAGCHSRVSDHLIVTAQAKNRAAYCQPVLVEAKHD